MKRIPNRIRFQSDYSLIIHDSLLVLDLRPWLLAQVPIGRKTFFVTGNRLYSFDCRCWKKFYLTLRTFGMRKNLAQVGLEHEVLLTFRVLESLVMGDF